jgi:hypothetical protein
MYFARVFYLIISATYGVNAPPEVAAQIRDLQTQINDSIQPVEIHSFLECEETFDKQTAQGDSIAAEWQKSHPDIEVHGYATTFCVYPDPIDAMGTNEEGRIVVEELGVTLP